MRRQLMIGLAALTLAAAIPAAASASVREGQAQIVSTVSFRTAPATSSEVVRYLKPGESVALLEQTNGYWWKVREAGGRIGYVSSNAKYLQVTQAPAEAADDRFNAVIVATVSFREGPSTSADRIRYLRADEQVTVTAQPNSYWYAVTAADGQTGYVSSSSSYIKLTGAIAAPSAGDGSPASGGDSGEPVGSGTDSSSSAGNGSDSSGEAAASTNAVIVATVSFREGPSTSADRIRYLRADEQVTVTGQPNSYWYAVTAADGQTGYVSSNAKYIQLTGPIASDPSTEAGAGSGGGANAGSGNESSGETNAGSGSGSDTDTGVNGGSDDSADAALQAKIEAVIAAGMNYLGTPYEYGSDRGTTTTFDCSDLVRQAFLDALGIKLPADSASQGAYVRARSTVTTDWRQLKRGDLMYFMDYKGTSAASYADKDPFTTKVSHTGIYLGDGKILHTYSKTSGGVRIDSIEGRHWEYRFLYGGSAL